MAKLFLLRHIKSQWNTENRFTGWVDAPLDKNELGAAKEISQKLFQSKIDAIFTSLLIRNRDTVSRILENTEQYPIFIHLDRGKMKKWGNFENINQSFVPVYVSEALNERCYGKLQGLNKDEVIKKYGQEIVRLWRRSFKVAPPDGESLNDVQKRVVKFYKKYIIKELKNGKNVLVVDSQNSLRALVKHLEKISDKDIVNFEIPYAGLREYEVDSKGKISAVNN